MFRKKAAITGAQYHFKSAMYFIQTVMNDEKDSYEEKIMMLDYFIDTVKIDITSDYRSSIFHDCEAKVLADIFPLGYYNENGVEQTVEVQGTIEIQLAESDIIVVPWCRERLINILKIIFKNGFQYQSSNQWSYFYPYLNLCYLYNGNHSVSSGIGLKQGTITSQVIDITSFFPHIYSDGEYWYNAHTKEQIIPVPDFRIAAIFEAAKIKFKLEGEITHNKLIENK